MDPSYETVIDTENLIWTMLVYLLHGAILFFHASVSGFLLATGSLGIFAPDLDRGWLRRLGATSIGQSNTRMLGAIRLFLGLTLLAPLVLGAPMSVSLIALIGSAVFLFLPERDAATAEKQRGRFIRRTAIAFATISALFMLWEREDNLVLGTDLLVHSMEWRNEELAWQVALDVRSPKVGDLAPDFELQDPDGNVRIRLSDFRGKRPVALVFGSYT
jgi:hypothetical protein